MGSSELFPQPRPVQTFPNQIFQPDDVWQFSERYLDHDKRQSTVAITTFCRMIPKMYVDVDRDGEFFLQNKNLANIPGGWWELETQGCSQCKGEAEHCNVITHIVAVVITLQCHHLQHGLVIASLCCLLSSHLLKFHLPTFAPFNAGIFLHQYCTVLSSKSRSPSTW